MPQSWVSPRQLFLFVCTMFQHLLVATDCTDGLHRLLQRLPDLQAGGVREILFLHSVPLEQESMIPHVDRAKVLQAEALLTLPPQSLAELSVQVEIPSGQPIPTILEAIKIHRPDLLVLGMPIRSLLNEKLFGSTTVTLLQEVNIPLLVLRPQLLLTLAQEELALRCQHLFHSLLLPYDGTDSACALVQRIRQQIQSAANLSTLVLCWVIDDERLSVGQRTEQLQQCQHLLAQEAVQLLELGLEVRTEVRWGNPVTETLAAAQDFDVRGIVISSPHVGKLWELSIPSFSGEILRRSWHPVLFFPPDRNL